MNQQKQIEEMANYIDKSHWRIEQDFTGCHINSVEIAEAIYSAGYREQNEIIKEFTEKLYAEFRMYGRSDKFSKEKFLTAVDKIAEEMKGGE